MDTSTFRQWIVRSAAPLGERWRTAAIADLETAEVWRDPNLLDLAPEHAARESLAPMSADQPGSRAP